LIGQRGYQDEQTLPARMQISQLCETISNNDVNGWSRLGESLNQQKTHSKVIIGHLSIVAYFAKLFLKSFMDALSSINESNHHLKIQRKSEIACRFIDVGWLLLQKIWKRVKNKPLHSMFRDLLST
jgi:hypothetical protein